MRRWIYAATGLLAAGGAALSCEDAPGAAAPAPEIAGDHAPRWSPASVTASDTDAGSPALVTDGGPDPIALGAAPHCRTVRVLRDAPVPDALVLISAPMDAPPTEHRTGPDGEVEVCPPLGAVVAVEAFDDEGRWNRLSGQWRDGDRAVELVLMDDPPAIDVRLVDEDGAPIEGGRVILSRRYAGDPIEVLAEAPRFHLELTGRPPPVTEAEGRARITLGRTGMFAVLADHPGYLMASESPIFTRPGDHHAVELTLRRAVHVCGTLELGGRPPEEGWVMLESERVTTDAEGRFCFAQRTDASARVMLRYGARWGLSFDTVVPASEPAALSLAPAGELRVEVRPHPIFARCNDGRAAEIVVQRPSDGATLAVGDASDAPASIADLPVGEVDVTAAWRGVEATARSAVRAGEARDVRIDLPLPSGFGILEVDGDDWSVESAPSGADVVWSCQPVPAGEYVFAHGDGETTRSRVTPGAVTHLRFEATPAPATTPRVIRLEDITVEEQCYPEVWLFAEDAGSGARVSYARRAHTRLLPGDLVLAIDGAGPDRAALAAAWPGERGATVVLDVERDGRRFVERLARTRCE